MHEVDSAMIAWWQEWSVKDQLKMLLYFESVSQLGTEVMIFYCLIEPVEYLKNVGKCVWAFTEWWLEGVTEVLGKICTPLPLCSMQILHGLIWAWTQLISINKLVKSVMFVIFRVAYWLQLVHLWALGQILEDPSVCLASSMAYLVTNHPKVRNMS